MERKDQITQLREDNTLIYEKESHNTILGLYNGKPVRLGNNTALLEITCDNKTIEKEFKKIEIEEIIKRRESLITVSTSQNTLNEIVKTCINNNVTVKIISLHRNEENKNDYKSYLCSFNPLGLGDTEYLEKIVKIISDMINSQSDQYFSYLGETILLLALECIKASDDKINIRNLMANVTNIQKIMKDYSESDNYVIQNYINTLNMMQEKLIETEKLCIVNVLNKIDSIDTVNEQEINIKEILKTQQIIVINETCEDDEMIGVFLIQSMIENLMSNYGQLLRNTNKKKVNVMFDAGNTKLENFRRRIANIPFNIIQSTIFNKNYPIGNEKIINRILLNMSENNSVLTSWYYTKPYLLETMTKEKYKSLV